MAGFRRIPAWVCSKGYCHTVGQIVTWYPRRGLDANGRVARSITGQAARELLNQRIGREFIEDIGAYYPALAAADAGDLKAPRRSDQSCPSVSLSAARLYAYKCTYFQAVIT